MFSVWHTLICLVCMGAAGTGTLAAPVPHLLPLPRLQIRQNNRGGDGGGTSVSPIFIVIGALVIVGVLFAVGGMCIKWRRYPTLVLDASDPEARTGIRLVAPRIRPSSKKARVISKDELDEMFPAVPYNKFLDEYRTAGSKPVFGKGDDNDNDKVNDNDNGTKGDLGVQPLDDDDDDSEHRFVCAICQTYIGHPEDDSDVEEYVHQVSTSSTTKRTTTTPETAPGVVGQDDEEKKPTTLHIENATTPVTTSNEGQATADLAVVEDEHVLVRHLSCHHVFHDRCIVPWLTSKKANCPLCQHSFLKAEEPQQQPQQPQQPAAVSGEVSAAVTAQREYVSRRMTEHQGRAQFASPNFTTA